MMTSPRLAIFLAGLAHVLVGNADNCFAQKPDLAKVVESYLPADGGVVDVMEVLPPARMVELTVKMQQALAKDPQWLQEHIKKNSKPGEPLPYDERFGLSKDEYQEYLGLGNKMTLRKTKTAKVHIKREEQLIELSFEEELPGLQKVVLDLKADSITTQLGTATERNEIKASENQKVTGPWNGVQWKLQKSDANPVRLTSIRFALGKMQDSGQGILYYNAKQLGENQTTKHDAVLLYDIKASK